MTASLSKGDQARAEILAAAQELFLLNGFHGTSMRAIAKAAGNRAVAGIYNHFPTKEAIFVALIEERNPYEMLFSTLETAFVECSTGPEFVRQALRGILEFMPQNYNFLQLAQIDLREFEGQTIRTLLETRFFPRLAHLLGRLGTLPGMKPVDPVVWMRTTASLVIGLMVTEQVVPASIMGNYSRAEWAEKVADILLFGMAGTRSNGPLSTNKE